MADGAFALAFLAQRVGIEEMAFPVIPGKRQCPGQAFECRGTVALIELGQAQVLPTESIFRIERYRFRISRQRCR